MTAKVITSLAAAGCLFAGPAQAELGACTMLREAVAAGDFLTAEDAADTPCRDERPQLPLRYDRAAGAPVAIEPLAPGTYLGRLSLVPGAIVAAGGKLQLVVRSGPVTIVRDVSAVRAVRAGAPAFVRTETGEVLTARFVASEQTP